MLVINVDFNVVPLRLTGSYCWSTKCCLCYSLGICKSETL